MYNLPPPVTEQPWHGQRWKVVCSTALLWLHLGCTSTPTTLHG